MAEFKFSNVIFDTIYCYSPDILLLQEKEKLNSERNELHQNLKQIISKVLVMGGCSYSIRPDFNSILSSPVCEFKILDKLSQKQTLLLSFYQQHKVKVLNYAFDK